MPERTRLKVKRIERIAFVDKGDNPEAHITILKRAPDGDELMVKDEAGLIERIVAAVKKAAGGSGNATETAATAASVEQETDTMADTKVEQDAVTKADIEAMQKRADELEKRAKEAEERVAKLEVEKREQAFAKKVAGWEHLPVKADTFAPIMRKIADALTDDEMGEVERVLAASNEAARTAGLFEEAGASGGAAEGSALAKAEARASELRKADPKLSKQAALGQVYKQDPALRREVEDEEAAARAAR